MSKAITGMDLWPKLKEAIPSLPDSVVWLELRMHYDEAATIKCEYYPEIDDLAPVFAEYKLEKIVNDDTDETRPG